jgi:hypothetical protein
VITRLTRDLNWHPYTIPGSAPEVEPARLRANRETGSFLALVRFPAARERPGQQCAAQPRVISSPASRTRVR